MDIVTTLGSVKTAIEIAKGIKDIKSLSDNAEIKLQLVDLIDALVETKADLADIKTQLIEKDKQIQELNEKLNTKDTLVYEEPFYWKVIEDNKEGPFCQRCHDADSKLVRLISKPNNTYGSHVCKVCESWYGKGVPRQPIRVQRSRGWAI